MIDIAKLHKLAKEYIEHDLGRMEIDAQKILELCDEIHELEQIRKGAVEFCEKIRNNGTPPGIGGIAQGRIQAMRALAQEFLAKYKERD